jgi:hypothetical protein
MTAAMNLVMKRQNQQTPNWFDVCSTAIRSFAELYQRRHANIYRFALHMSGGRKWLMMSLRKPSWCSLTKARFTTRPKVP